MSTLVFSRTEKKFFLNENMYYNLMSELSPLIQPDEYGKYTICNIYYDTMHYDLISNSLQKPVYKEKLRLRSYGVPGWNENVFVEIKKKFKKTVSKRRVVMTLREAEHYLDAGIQPSENSQILHEINYFLQRHPVAPKVYLAYDREAYTSVDDPNLRITFDMNIRSREYDLSLAAGDYGEYLFDEPYHLMEIKAGASMPMWLTAMLAENKIYPNSFSKYGNFYKKKKNAATIIGGEKLCLKVS